MASLSIELLRSFVAVVEKGSIQRATERIFLTQSALSLQIRRLEEIVQRPLFRREMNKRLAITPAGLELLEYAREMLALNDRAIAAMNLTPLEEPIRVSMPPDVAEAALPGVLREFRRRHPQVRLAIRIGGAPIGGDQTDIILSPSQQPDAAALTCVPVRWIGDAELTGQDELPLVLLPEPCVFRANALHALERAGRKYRIAVEATNFAGLIAAVKGGLGVTARPAAFLQLDATVLADGTLPKLSDVHYGLHHNSIRETPGADLVALLRNALAHPPKRAVRKLARGA